VPCGDLSANVANTIRFTLAIIRMKAPINLHPAGFAPGFKFPLGCLELGFVSGMMCIPSDVVEARVRFPQGAPDCGF
jgi:hypothetical protein